MDHDTACADDGQFCSSIVDHFCVSHVHEDSVIVTQRHVGQRLVFFDGELDGKPKGLSAGSLAAKIFDHHGDPDMLTGIVGAMKHAFDHGINCAMPVETRKGKLVASFRRLMYVPTDRTQDGETREVTVSTECALAEEREGEPPNKKKKRKYSSCEESNYCLVYLMTGLPGRPFSQLVERTDYLRFCLGHQMGLLSKVLQGFRSDVIKRRRHEFYDLQNFLALKKFTTLCRDQTLRPGILRTFRDFERYVAPHVPVMTSGTRHGDTNLHNFLYNPNQDGRVYHSSSHENLEDDELHGLMDGKMDPPQLFGVVDFDEVVYGPYLFDLASAVKHEIQLSHMSGLSAGGRGVGLEAAIPMIAGFQKAFSLPDDEIDMLYYAVCARMVQIYLGMHLALQQYCGNHDNGVVQRYEDTRRDTGQYMELFFAQEPQTVCKTWNQYRTFCA